MNYVSMLGRLTKDPELKQVGQDGKCVCTAGIAVPRKKFGPNAKDEVDFFNIVAWNKTGEFLNKYFTKGKQLLISGELRSRSYDDTKSPGRKVHVVEINVDNIDFTGSKDSSGGGGNTQQAQSQDSGFYPIDDDGSIDDRPF